MIDCAVFVRDKTLSDVPDLDICLSAFNGATEIVGKDLDGGIVIIRRDPKMIYFIGRSIRRRDIERLDEAGADADCGVRIDCYIAFAIGPLILRGDRQPVLKCCFCLLYTSDAADE